MKLTKIALAASFITGASLANASDIKLGLQGGYASSSETVNSTAPFHLGDGNSIGVFAIIPISDLSKELSIKIAINSLRKKDSYSTTSTTSPISREFTRNPIDVLLLKQIEKLQFGIGLTYHMSPEYERVYSDGFIQDTPVDNTFGLALEANYQIYGNDAFNVNFGVRYTRIEYKIHYSTPITLDGSNFAFTAGIIF